MRRMHRQAGFSLIEILAVVALIGMVVAFAVNQIGDNAQRARWSLAKSQLQTLGAKIEQYELDNGSPPQRLEDLLKAPANAAQWNGPYAKESELKDPWQNPFVYRAPGTNGAFDLTSLGADKKPGGDSHARDINSWE
jgi:general secretion pathway protein G